MKDQNNPSQSNQVLVHNNIFTYMNNSAPSAFEQPTSSQSLSEVLVDLGLTFYINPTEIIKKENCNVEEIKQLILQALQNYTEGEVARVFAHDHGIDNLNSLVRHYDQLFQLKFTKQHVLAMVERDYGYINLTTVAKHAPLLMQIGFLPDDIFNFVNNNIDPKELDCIFSHVYQLANDFCKKPCWNSRLIKAMNILHDMYFKFPILQKSGFKIEHMLRIAFYHPALKKLIIPFKKLPEFLDWGFGPDQVTSILANDTGLDNFNTVYKHFPTLAKFGFTPHHVSNMACFEQAGKYLKVFIKALPFFANHFEKLGAEEKSLIINKITFLISNCGYAEGQKEFFVKVKEMKCCMDEHQFLQKLSEKQDSIADTVHRESKKECAKKRKRISSLSNEESLKITETQLGTFATAPVQDPNLVSPFPSTMDIFADLSQDIVGLRPEDIEEINRRMP